MVVFPSTRLRTVRTPLDVYGSLLILSVHFSIVYFSMAVEADGQCFSSSCYHVFLPVLFAFQVFEFSDMMHLEVFTGSAVLTFLGFQSVNQTGRIRESCVG